MVLELSTMVDNLNTDEIITQEENIFKTKLTQDLIVIIGSFLPASDLNKMGQCDQFLLDLFFSLDIDKINAIIKRKNEYLQLEMETKIVCIKDLYKDDESFERVQTLIWKPLVIHYFPNYSKSLNVKNWMHVLRRRIIHLQSKHSNVLPLSDTNREKKSGREIEKDFIENCEWEYECPLKVDSLRQVSENVKYCQVCREQVYRVYDETEYKTHVEANHCVIFSVKNQPTRIMMGKRVRR